MTIVTTSALAGQTSQEPTLTTSPVLLLIMIVLVIAIATVTRTIGTLMGIVASIVAVIFACFRHLLLLAGALALVLFLMFSQAGHGRADGPPPGPPPADRAQTAPPTSP